jgi:hypothetical protein
VSRSERNKRFSHEKGKLFGQAESAHDVLPGCVDTENESPDYRPMITQSLMHVIRSSMFAFCGA